mgnify:CR=1 FL=1
MNRLLKVFLGVILAAVSAGCGRDYRDELVVTSPHSPEIRNEFARGFSDWYLEKRGKNIDVQWLDVGGTGECIEYVLSRREKGDDTGVDIFFGGGTFPFIRLEKENMLEPYVLRPRISAKIPAAIHGDPVYSPKELWYGAALSGFGIIFNRAILDDSGLPEPKTWKDLAQPECSGWVSSGDPRYSGSIQAMYEILLQAYGWEKGWEIIARIGANVQNFEKGGSSAAKNVSRGQAAYGLSIDFYAFGEIARYGRDRLGFVLPEGETVVNPDGIGLLKNAPNEKAAEDFIEYVLSEGQKLWMFRKGVKGGPVEKTLSRFSVDETLYDADPEKLAVTMNPFKIKSALDYDESRAGKRWSILGDLIAAFVIVPHRELKESWQEIIRQNLPEEEYARFFRIELTEARALELAETWDDKENAEKRIKLMNTWTENARQRFSSVEK